VSNGVRGDPQIDCADQFSSRFQKAADIAIVQRDNFVGRQQSEPRLDTNKGLVRKVRKASGKLTKDRHGRRKLVPTARFKELMHRTPRLLPCRDR